MKFRATFFGKQKDAIGISYDHIDFVEGEDEEGARLNLYNTHEHLQNVRLSPLSEDHQPFSCSCGRSP